MTGKPSPVSRFVAQQVRVKDILRPFPLSPGLFRYSQSTYRKSGLVGTWSASLELAYGALKDRPVGS